MKAEPNFFTPTGRPIARFGLYILALVVCIVFYFPVAGTLLNKTEGVAGRISTPEFESLVDAMIKISLRTACGIAGILLSLLLFIREPFRNMIAKPWQPVAGRFLMCVGIYVLAVLLKDALVGLATGKPLHFNSAFLTAENADVYLVALSFGLAMVPLQSLTEEIIYRSFIVKGFNGLFSRRWFLMLMSGLFFSLNHGGQDLFYWLLLSVILVWSVIKSNSIIYAWAIHAGHNFYYMFVLGGTSHSEDAMTLFLQDQNQLSLWMELLAVVVTLSVISLKRNWSLTANDFLGKADDRAVSHVES